MIIHTSPLADVEIPQVPITEYVLRLADTHPDRNADHDGDAHPNADPDGHRYSYPHSDQHQHRDADKHCVVMPRGYNLERVAHDFHSKVRLRARVPSRGVPNVPGVHRALRH